MAQVIDVLRRSRTLIATMVALGTFVAGRSVTRNVEAQVTFSALPLSVQAPANNPIMPGAIELGRLLFWDPILSGEKDISCATCHHPQFGYAESLDVSIGVNGEGLGPSRHFVAGNTIPFVKRNSQTLLNSAFNGIGQDGRYQPAQAPMFWDLRVRSLETQALEPIKALEEMRGTSYAEGEALDQVVRRLGAIPDYRDRFARVFGAADPVNATNLGKAIATFERVLVASNSPFDRYMRGDATAMTPAQIRGMQSFEQAGCANCHSGPMFSDFKLHVLGVPDNAKLSASDSSLAGDYAFRTPTLRNLAYTAPYTHSGTVRSVNDMLQFYDRVNRGGGGRRGGGFDGASRRGTNNPNVSGDQLDPLLRQLRLGRNRGEILQFLGALNDDSFDQTIPARVPSGLPVGGRLQ